jgi:predicted DNA binding CopG/RHH family protein
MPKNNPFASLKLDKEEQLIDQAIETGKVSVVDDQKSEKSRLKLVAKHTIGKTKQINIRLSLRDLQKLKAKAMENGLPYQTLISTVLRQFTIGKVQVSL